MWINGKFRHHVPPQSCCSNRRFIPEHDALETAKQLQFDLFLLPEERGSKMTHRGIKEKEVYEQQDIGVIVELIRAVQLSDVNCVRVNYK